MSTSVDFSELDKRITLQQRAETQGASGGQDVTWTDVLSCWAKISPVSGRALDVAASLQAQVSHVVTIRYRPNITAKMRVLFQSRTFDIVAPLDEDENHVVLNLFCVEGTSSG
jgi:SPP1 family predicted phage head-tail adaptor